MIQQSDTIVQQAAQADSLQAVKHTNQLTPKQVVSWLPKDATPAQMDSAIQRHIKASETHWSERPDTLHLPGHAPAKSFRDARLPQYYKESFFSKDSLFHPELTGGRLGVAGDPIPYTIANDNFFVSLLLGCFILIVVGFSQSRSFILRQAKNFFRVSRSNVTAITETSAEIRFQVSMLLQTCLMLALCFFFYARERVGGTFVVDFYQVLGIFFGVTVLYFFLKMALYWLVDWVFFDKKKNEQWQKAFLFVSAMMGVVLFPMVMLQIFFELPLQSILFFALLVVILAEMLSLYKVYIIFFKDKAPCLQLILYLCALEIVPLLTLWGVLTSINGYLKINF